MAARRPWPGAGAPAGEGRPDGLPPSVLSGRAGYGTDDPAPLACSSGQFGGFGGGGFGGQGNPLDADYAALMQISHTTGGTFYRAQDADELSRALAKLPAAFTIVRKHLDIASWFAAAGGLLIAAAVALSLYWNRTRRMPAPAEQLPGSAAITRCWMRKAASAAAGTR